MDTGHTGERAVSRFELSSDESASEGVVRVVASLTGLDPVAKASAPTAGDALEPLYSVVDPEALDSLFRTTGLDDGRVSFAYHGYEITVHRERAISAERLDGTTEGA